MQPLHLWPKATLNPYILVTEIRAEHAAMKGTCLHTPRSGMDDVGWVM